MTTEAAGDQLLAKLDGLLDRMSRRDAQKRRHHRRLRHVQDTLQHLDALEYLGFVPGAGLVLGKSAESPIVIISVQPSCVVVRLRDEREAMMDAVNLINLVAAEGGRVVSARESSPSPVATLLQTERRERN